MPIACEICGKENAEFFKFTPYGEFFMGLVKGVNVGMFKPGKEYYIDITEANSD